MRIRVAVGRAVTAVGVASLCAIGVPDAPFHSLLHGGLAPLSASATGCTSWSPPPWRFTGQNIAQTNAGGVSASISINQPVYVCATNAYWVMVFGPPGINKGGCKEGNESYAQNGWLVGSDYVPRHYYEAADVQFCDPGAVYWPCSTCSATYGTTHTYETQVQANPNAYASFWIDGGLMGSLQTDWYLGQNFMISAETQRVENRVGGESFGSMYGCTLNPNNPVACTPSTSLSAACGGQQGCLPPTNPYGCYLQTGGNSFNVYDSRGNGGHC